MSFDKIMQHKPEINRYLTNKKHYDSNKVQVKFKLNEKVLSN